MDSGMRVVLALLGVLVGAALSHSSLLVGAALGGFVGFSIAEFSILRAMIAKLEQEIARLRRQTSEQDIRQAAAASPLKIPAAAVMPAAATPSVPIAPEVANAPATPATRPALASVSPRPQHAMPPSPPRTRAPDAPLIAAIKRFFAGGNTLVQAGVVVLFFGVAFLLRYIAEHSHVSIEVRLSAVALAAVVLLVLGWRLRRSRAGYALALQGGGVGILYLTVFAAMRLYGLLPAPMAFVFLVLIAAFSAALAVLQDSAAFAVLGVIGGFLAPILAATGEGNHVVLFTYYAVLNSGIAIVAWFKAWRPLNLAGFLFTFAIGTAWGVLKFQPQYFASTEPFLIFFFLLYVAIALLFTLRQPLDLRGYVDGALVFGNPIAAFGLQSAMLRHDSMALAYSALGMSALYILLAFVVQRRRDASQTLLIESFLSLAVAFLTVAIPLALGSRLNSAAWALEGAALVWIGCRQNRRLARAAGTLLTTGAALLLVGEVSFIGETWVIPMDVLPGVILVSAACIVSVLNLDRSSSLSGWEQPYAHVLFGVGLLVWVVGGLGVLPHLGTTTPWIAEALGFFAFSALGLSELARRVNLQRAAASALALLPLMYIFFIEALARGTHPFAAAGWLAWTAAFGVLYVLLHRHEGPSRTAASSALETLSAWLFCTVLGWEAGWGVGFAIAPASPEWAQAARVLPPVWVLLLLPRLVNRVKWPFVTHRILYVSVIGVGLCAGLVVWSLASNFLFAGDAAPLPYLPLLNPLDVAQALALFALLQHWRQLRSDPVSGFKLVSPWLPPAVLATLLFVWLNAMLLRSLHHWIGVPLRVDALIASNVVETSVSIFWSALALVTMLLASRNGKRPAWLVGATLMTVVIIKLFFVDLASVGSIERIVSFVGVGVAMLVVGYFSPLPPRLKES